MVGPVKRSILLPLLVLSLLAVSCDRLRQAGGEGTTTVTATTPAVTERETTETRRATTTTTETEAAPTSVPGRPDYTIVSRTPGDSGDSVVVLIEPDDYTDVQIENVIRDVVESYAPVKVVHLVDDPEAAAAVLSEDPTPEERRILEEHYLARLEEGARLVYLGPYAEYDSKILGS